MNNAKVRRELKKNGLYLKKRGRHYWCNGDYDLTYDVVDNNNIIQLENITISDLIEILSNM